MKKTSLSVIIPNYNKEMYLEECLNSILCQSLLPDEIIVVDDCSTDNSAKIIKEFEAKTNGLVKGVFLQINGGVSNARNTGLAQASSEYVTFTDSDDFYYSKDKIKNEMSVIMRHAQKGEDVVAYSAIVRADTSGKAILMPNLMKPNFMKGDVYLDLMARIKLENIPRDYCVKKDMLVQIGAYNYPRNFYEDLDLLFRLSRQLKFYPTYQNGIAYRLTNNGLSKRAREEHRGEISKILATYGNDLTPINRITILLKKAGFFFWRIFRKLLRMLRKER